MPCPYRVSQQVSARHHFANAQRKAVPLLGFSTGLGTASLRQSSARGRAPTGFLNRSRHGIRRTADVPLLSQPPHSCKPRTDLTKACQKRFTVAALWPLKRLQGHVRVVPAPAGRRKPERRKAPFEVLSSPVSRFSTVRSSVSLPVSACVRNVPWQFARSRSPLHLIQHFRGNWPNPLPPRS